MKDTEYLLKTKSEVDAMTEIQLSKYIVSLLDTMYCGYASESTKDIYDYAFSVYHDKFQQIATCNNFQ